MTTDRELLELAAKAAGIEVTSVHDGDDATPGWPFAWNPITDDGDALRLLTTLRIELIWWRSGVSASQDGVLRDIEPLRDDPAAATRRAIVRAAAAIGESLAKEAP